MCSTLPRYVGCFPLFSAHPASFVSTSTCTCLPVVIIIPLSWRAVGKAPQLRQVCVMVLPSTGKVTQNSPGLIFYLAIEMPSVSPAISVLLFSLCPLSFCLLGQGVSVPAPSQAQRHGSALTLLTIASQLEPLSPQTVIPLLWSRPYLHTVLSLP